MLATVPTETAEVLDLGQGFRRYFAIAPALSEELRREAFRIRHDVYCDELGYEPRRDDGLESDEYDSQSVHCLIRSLKSGNYVGGARLVLARRSDPLYPLPFERICEHGLDRSIVDPRKLPRHSMAEVSRLAVVSAFRARRGERAMLAPLTDESFGTVSRPRFPFIIVGLYLGIIELASLHGIDTLFVLTERRLAVHLARLGVALTPIGAEVEHRGTRIPSMLRVSSVVAGLNFMVRPLYQVVAQQVRAAYSQALERFTPPTR